MKKIKRVARTYRLPKEVWDRLDYIQGEWKTGTQALIECINGRYIFLNDYMKQRKPNEIQEQIKRIEAEEKIQLNEGSIDEFEQLKQQAKARYN